MEPATVLSLANAAAPVGWLALALSRLAPCLLAPFGGVAVPVALSALYVVTAAVALPGAAGGFGSLDAVMTLLAQPGAALAGWIHVLAFDLLLGGWAVRDARRRGVPHRAVLPCLLLTFMLGPAGFLAYLAARAALSRKESPA